MVDLRHAFVSPVMDRGNSEEVGPDEWNAAHTLMQAGERLLGKATAGDGPTEELDPLAVSGMLTGVVTPAMYGTVDLTGVSSSQTAVAAAVAAAYAAGIEMYWPAGTYLTTASIPNLHDVRHHGPGVIKRGSDLFYVAPRDSQTNRLYVSTSGSASNDGLSSSFPKTLASTFAACSNYGPMLRGSWSIELAAGTYTDGAAWPEGLSSVNRVTVKGPSVSYDSPTAIFDGAAATLGYAMWFRRGSRHYVKDVAIQDFVLGGAGYGILHQDWSDLYCDNVRISGCTYGVGSRNHTILRYRAGFIKDCVYAGVLGIDFPLMTIGYVASTVPHATNTQMLSTDGVVISGNSRGVFASENGQGHVDYCLVDDNTWGIEINYASRLNIPGCTISNNTIGTWVRSGSFALDTSSTYATNTTDRRYDGMSGNVDAELNQTPGLGHVVHLGASVSDNADPGATGSFVQHVPVFAALPANGLRSSKGKLRVVAQGTISKGSAGSGRSYSFRVYCGASYLGAASIDTNFAAAGQVLITLEVSATSANAQRGIMWVEAGDVRTSDYYKEGYAISSALDLTAERDISIYTSRDSASDTVTFHYASAELFGDM